MGRIKPSGDDKQALDDLELKSLRILFADDVYSGIKRIVRARWGAGILLVVVTAISVYLLNLPLRVLPLYLLGIIILLYNTAFALYIRRCASSQHMALKPLRRVILLQVALDWLCLSVFIHLTGGIASPGIPVLMIHMLMVTILLPYQTPYWFVIIGTLVLLLVTGLELFNVIPHIGVIPGFPLDLHRNTFYVLSVLTFFAATAFMSVYLTSSIMRRLRWRERQIIALFETSRAISSTLSLPEVMDRLAKSAADALNAQGALIRLLDETGDQLKMTASYGLSQSYLDKGPVSIAHSKLDVEALSGTAVLVDDAPADSRIQYPEQVKSEGIRSMLVAPIRGSSRVLGVLRVYANRPASFTNDDVVFLTAVAEQGAIALENALVHENLHDVNQERAQFVRLVTHELRAPVTSAQSLLRVLLQGVTGTLTNQQADILGRIDLRLNTLLELINDLLTLAATKTNFLAQELTRIPLQPVVLEVVEHMRHLAEEKHLSLTCDLPSEALPVLVAEDGLRRVLENLIGNAIKYTPEGGQVRVRVVEYGAQVATYVEDTGIGIPEEELQNLWNEFFRATNAKKTGITGTGLGLSIVKQVVEQFGGTVSAQNREGQGTVFRFTLPLA
nr:GAF domain-containing sensor histidine kinase [Anaerolineae bacterium]